MGNNFLPSPTFWANLADLGAGAVDTSLNVGSGSATFTRATVAWTKLSTGLWAQVASGTARSGYLGNDTTVGAYGGYFSENAGTQLVTPTASIRDMTDASWVAVTCTKAKTATGIDGAVNSASTLTATGATATVLQTLVAAATSRTFSAFVRRKTGTGTVFIQQGATQVDITALINSSTYTRVSVTASILNSAFGFQLNTSGDAIEVDFNQFEAGAIATSPMASAGAARNADNLRYSTASNIDGTLGSWYAEAAMTSLNTGFNQCILQGTTGTMLDQGDPTLIRNFDGTTLTDSPSGTSFVGSIRKAAASWSGANKISAKDGASATGSFDGDMSLGATIFIGTNNATQAWTGFVKNVRFYGLALNSAQLNTLTT